MATGYRTLPAEIPSPAVAEIISEQEFASLQVQKLQEAPSLCTGHEGTTIWYVKGFGYIVQVHLHDNRSVFVRSLCTFTPTFGMDKIDGLFAQDIEEYILNQELSRESARLAISQGRDNVPVQEYLRSHHLLK